MSIMTCRYKYLFLLIHIDDDQEAMDMHVPLRLHCIRYRPAQRIEVTLINRGRRFYWAAASYDVAETASLNSSLRPMVDRDALETSLHTGKREDEDRRKCVGVFAVRMGLKYIKGLRRAIGEMIADTRCRWPIPLGI